MNSDALVVTNCVIVLISNLNRVKFLQNRYRYYTFVCAKNEILSNAVKCEFALSNFALIFENVGGETPGILFDL